MFRKRKRVSPHFKINPPYNAIQGEQANLRQDGVSPFCAMMQVAAEDTYANYVICRGFDTRILRFIDYELGNTDKPGICVAKPYGKRTVGTYEIGQIYPALLPTQGNTDYSGFRQVTYVPPSPVAVNWRVGQNPGKVTGGGLEGGQPEALTDTIEILYDHNGKVVNWLLIDSAASGGGASIQGTLTALVVGTGDYTGKYVATIAVAVAPCDRSDLIGTSVDVVDWSGCIFDLTEEELIDVWVWANENVAFSLDAGATAGQLTPCHWTASDRCCVAADASGSSSINGGTP